MTLGLSSVPCWNSPGPGCAVQAPLAGEMAGDAQATGTYHWATALVEAATCHAEEQVEKGAKLLGAKAKDEIRHFREAMETQERSSREKINLISQRQSALQTDHEVMHRILADMSTRLSSFQLASANIQHGVADTVVAATAAHAAMAMGTEANTTQFLPQEAGSEQWLNDARADSVQAPMLPGGYLNNASCWDAGAKPVHPTPVSLAECLGLTSSTPTLLPRSGAGCETSGLCTLSSQASIINLDAALVPGSAEELRESAQTLTANLDGPQCKTYLDTALAAELAETLFAQDPFRLSPWMCNFTEKVFSFTIRKTQGIALGLVWSPEQQGRVLYIESILPGSSIDIWNQQCATAGEFSKQVHPGEYLIGVNTVAYDAQGMIGECNAKQLLRLTVCRAEAGQPVGAACVAL